MVIVNIIKNYHIAYLNAVGGEVKSQLQTTVCEKAMLPGTALVK